MLADRDRLCCIELIPNGIRHTPDFVVMVKWRSHETGISIPTTISIDDARGSYRPRCRGTLMDFLSTNSSEGPTWRGPSFGALTWGGRPSERPTCGRQTLGAPTWRGRSSEWVVSVTHHSCRHQHLTDACIAQIQGLSPRAGLIPRSCKECMALGHVW